LAPGLLKGERFDWLLQKATELGVSRIFPMVTRHAVVKLPTSMDSAKTVRWHRIINEAAMQCGRRTLPSLEPPQPFETALEQIARATLVLIPTLAVTTIPLRDVLARVPSDRLHGGSVAVLIGPEGDFAPEEIARAERMGARPVSLGPLTLRSETAALAAVALLTYALDV
jgi:16S rRNA (uracil1498-N3)-methyltransferase